MSTPAIQAGHLLQQARANTVQRRSWAVIAFVIIGLAVTWLIFGYSKTTPAGLRFALVSYSDLPGWSENTAVGAAPALKASCAKISQMKPSRSMPGSAIGGKAGDWLEACEALSAAVTDVELKAAFSAYFLPLEVSAGGTTDGIFTGYYEALLKGSLKKTDRFTVPLYARPPELVMVNLGRFRKDLAGQRIAGTVKDGRLQPFPNRASIENGALAGRDLEVLWVDSAVDAYFLHVQGSGRVLMPDGSFFSIGYAAQNGHANRLIGRRLIEMGAIPREEMSGQAIRKWLADHPDQIQSVLDTDPSFVFFRALEGDGGPYGSAGVGLTPGHSIAVDRRHLPLHAPIWLSASHPDPNDTSIAEVAFNRLMVAQDTGGAINGEIRGDVFWGFGPEAEEIAGRMANGGRYWLLLPKKLALAAAGSERG